MADVVVTVQASGGDYTTIEAAVDDWAANAGSGDTYFVRLTENITEDVDVNIAGASIDELVIEGNDDDPANFPIITGGIDVNHNNVPTRVERLKVTTGMNMSGSVWAGIWGDAGTTTKVLTVNRCIVYGLVPSNANNFHLMGIALKQMAGDIMNCLVYDIERDATTNNRRVFGIKASDGTRLCNVLNCTVDDIHNNFGTMECYAFAFDDQSNTKLRNCAGSNVTHDGTGTTQVFEESSPSNADVDYVASDDSSHSGSNSIAVNATNDYEDAAGRDYTLASGSALEDEGEDLGTTPTNVQFALNDARNRDTEADTWDISCYELVAAGVTLTVQDLAHSHSLDAPVLTQKHSLTVNDMAHGHALDAPTLTQKHTLIVDALAHAQALDNVVLTQKQLLVVDDLTHAHVIDAVAITQKHTLAVQELLHAHGLEAPTLTQKHILAVQELLHSHALENVTLSTGSTLLVVQDLLHTHALDAPALTQKHVLTVEDLAHAHTLDPVTLSLSITLIVQGMQHGHQVENVGLTQKHLLALQDLLHSHQLDGVVLTQKHILAVQELLHNHSLAGVVFADAIMAQESFSHQVEKDFSHQVEKATTHSVDKSFTK